MGPQTTRVGEESDLLGEKFLEVTFDKMGFIDLGGQVEEGSSRDGDSSFPKRGARIDRGRDKDGRERFQRRNPLNPQEAIFGPDQGGAGLLSK